MMTNKTLISDLAIPPGEFLEEVLEGLGMSKEELSHRMGRPASKLSAIFKGEKAITPDTALQLEKVVGVPAHIWTGLESEYRLTLAKCAEQEPIEQQLPLIGKFCYHSLVKLGFCADKKDKREQLEELHRFFGVTSLQNVAQIGRYQPAFRCATGKKARSPEATAAWLRMGETRSRNIDCGEFKREQLRELLPEIRKLTLQGSEALNEKLPTLLSKAGVAFVLLPHLKGTFAHGAAFSMGKEKAVLMATIRYSWTDIVWFSIFHEIAHLLLHARDEMILECGKDAEESPDKERQADEFAANTLIPQKKYSAFLQSTDFSLDSIRKFAEQEEIHPGIIVGRLQFEDKIPPNARQNVLRARFKWKN